MVQTRRRAPGRSPCCLWCPRGAVLLPAAHAAEPGQPCRLGGSPTRSARPAAPPRIQYTAMKYPAPTGWLMGVLGELHRLVSVRPHTSGARRAPRGRAAAPLTGSDRSRTPGCSCDGARLRLDHRDQQVAPARDDRSSGCRHVDDHRMDDLAGVHGPHRVIDVVERDAPGDHRRDVELAVSARATYPSPRRDGPGCSTSRR